MSDSTITIGGSTKDLKEADSAWVASQLNGRNHGDAPVCVRVRIKTPNVDISLASGACPSSGGGGGGRQPNMHESNLLDLWNKKHLNQPEFSVGNLVSFVEEVRGSL